jgi:hypothetical protein
MHSFQYQFAKQFFITKKQELPLLFSQWCKSPLKSDSVLYSHPALEVTRVENKNTHIVCLGHIINPYIPTDTNKNILDKILENTAYFDTFEKSIYSMGGRWVLIVNSKEGKRIYHDAAGLKPVFFSSDKDKNINIASQPALLEAIGVCHKQEDVFNDFKRYRNSKSWPLGIIPYTNVKQLIPNHYLDLNTRETSRYWPKSKLSITDVNVAAKKLSTILQGSIKALTLRNNCTMSLTGGYDSRMLFSCALNDSDKINFFTTISNFTPEYDRKTPEKLSKRYNLNHQFTQRNIDNNPDQNSLDILSKNVGDMYYDRSMPNIFAFSAAIKENTHLPGSVSEIARCYYYPYGLKLLKPTGKRIAKYAGFKGNPYAEEGFSRWLNNLPVNLPYEILDLLYWEHRLGIWASCGLTFREGVLEQIPPMNNREYMEISLAVNMKDRLPPHNLTKSIIKINDKNLLNLLFNGSEDYWLYNRFPKIKYLRNVIATRLK